MDQNNKLERKEIYRETFKDLDINIVRVLNEIRELDRDRNKNNIIEKRLVIKSILRKRLIYDR